MSPELEGLIAAFYKARVMHLGDIAKTKAEIATALANSAPLKAEAMAELSRIDGLLALTGPAKLRDRCFASWVAHEALSSAINP
jgi:hypothetical protein